MEDPLAPFEAALAAAAEAAAELETRRVNCEPTASGRAPRRSKGRATKFTRLPRDFAEQAGGDLEFFAKLERLVFVTRSSTVPAAALFLALPTWSPQKFRAVARKFESRGLLKLERGNIYVAIGTDGQLHPFKPGAAGSLT